MSIYTALGIQQTFPMGRLVMTRGVNDRVADDSAFAKHVTRSIKRHAQQDWGELDDEDKRSNDRGVSEKHPDRLLSSYGAKDDPNRIWIITEWDRSVTTILFPDEY